MGTLARRRLWNRLLALLCAAPLLAPGAVLAGTFDTDLSSMPAKFPKKPREQKEGEILVKFKASVPPSVRDDKHRREGHLKLRELRGSGVHQVRLSPALTVEQAIARYRADSAVEYAEPNYLLRAMRLPSETTGFSLLWGMNNTGQTLGTPGADIRAPLAWDLVTGSADVAVMVIDSGVDYTHSDLAANIWVNPGEIAGNGVDDDGNGQVDDLRGIDVVNGDGDPMDDYGHGTHVAGTIGAVGNNALGVVGVNWAVKIIPCKFLDAAGSGTVADAVTCLEYARELKARGVNIVATNNSYGGLGAFSQTMFDAIKAQPDILFIAAAGNFGIDNDTADFHPAGYDLPNVLSVAATDHNDLKPAFSSFGRRTVHLGAPGANITSTTPFGNYSAANGTSMSAPHVTGLAALLAAQNPARDWRAIRNLILAGGDTSAATSGQTISGRRLSTFGSASCIDKPLFSVLRLPAAFTVGVPATVSALSINCAGAVGPVTATASSGQTFTLVDDGVAPDQAAGDGVFTATWTPTQAFGSITFGSPAGAEQVGMLDLTIIGVSGPLSADRGQTLSLGVTVANPSAMAAPASSAKLVLSVDGVITTADTLLGSVPTPALAAGAQQSVSASVTVPANLAPGTYFVGAIVDPDGLIAEGNETNNARTGSTIAIGTRSVDLAVSVLSGPPTAFTGDAVTLTATVANSGTTVAESSTLSFYLSGDQVINHSDTLLGSAAIGVLPGGAAQTVSVSVALPVTLPPGTYFLGAIADADGAIIETNETNNSRVGNTLATTTRAIDLVLSAVSGSATARDMQSISLSATVKNLGSETAPPSTVRWFLSTDDVITTADIPLASLSVGALRGGGTAKLAATAVVPASVAAGDYVIGAIVDPDNTLAETNNANNARTGGTMTVSYSADLSMTDAAGPSAGATGQSLTFTGTVRNRGLAASGNVTVGFYLSTDSSITTADALIATATVPPIAAGASVPVSVTAALRSALKSGSYTIGAIADPGNLIPESNESDNARSGNSIAVSYGPDLVVTSVAGPATVNRGQTVTLNATVRNQGIGSLSALSDQDLTTTASAVRLGFYLSTNSSITASDTLVAAVPIPTLATGQSVPLSITVTLPSSIIPGTYTIGAIADYSNGINESTEVNNALAGNQITVK